MKKQLITFLLILLSSLSTFAQRPFDIQGHRGARGYSPENTIPGFKKGLEIGVDTLELDVVVTRDHKLVVSHEPWFDAIFSLDKVGHPIPVEKQRDHNIYKMTYKKVKQYDVGSIGHKDFPEQEKIKVAKPLLSKVFTELAKFARLRKLPSPRYNIEIKTEENGDDIFNPKPDVFAQLLLAEIRKAKLPNSNVIVQSFDVRALREMRKIAPEISLALLLSNRDGLQANLDRLGFVPAIYSPHHPLVDAELVKLVREKGMKIIPWTVNKPADLERLRSLNLDGVITDYPDRAIKVFRGLAHP